MQNVNKSKLEISLAALNNKNPKQSCRGKHSLTHITKIKVQDIVLFKRNSPQSPLSMSLYTVNCCATLLPEYIPEDTSKLANHPLLNPHIGHFKVPINEEQIKLSRNPFIGRRVVLIKELDSPTINVCYQKTILGIPFNSQAENVTLVPIRENIQPIPLTNPLNSMR